MKTIIAPKGTRNSRAALRSLATPLLLRTSVCLVAPHEQIWIKVNVPVDKGVSGIVAALSGFPGLETVESCEGDNNYGPWVCFRFGRYWEHPWRELASFVLGYMAPRLMDSVGDDANVRIQTTPSGQIFGELSVRPGAVSRVETALRELNRDFSVCRRHSSEYCGDRSGTSQ